MFTKKHWVFVLLCAGGMLATGSALAADLRFELTLARNDIQIHTRDAGTEVVVARDGFETLADEGAPALPFRVVAVLLPQGSDVASFRVETGIERVLQSNVNVIAAGPPTTEDGKIGHGAALAPQTAGAPYPSERARLLGVGTLHGYTIASFAVFPLRVDGGDLLWSEDLTLHVETGPATGLAPVTLERRRPEVRARARDELARLVLNPKAADGYAFSEVDTPQRQGGFQAAPFPSLEGSPVDYLIITTDAQAAAYQVLADFKTAKGVPTVVRTVEWILTNTRNGSDPQETIRNFVIEAYSKWGITYLLLGGDTEQMPARFCWSSFYDGGRFLPVDMYFGNLDGDWNKDHDAIFGEGGTVDSPDLYSEVYVGRLPSASVAQANLMIGKIIAFETPTDITFAQKVLFLAEVLFPFGWSPPQQITLNGADLAEPVYTLNMTAPDLNVTRMYETPELFPGSVQETKAAALAAMSAGQSQVIHIGHGYRFTASVGNSSIVNADVDMLTNGNKLFNLYFLNCSGVAYDYPCLAEYFMRHPNGGAVSVAGANESAFPNASSYYMNEYFELMFDDVYNAGATFARSRLPRTVVAVMGDNIDLWTHYIYSLLSDPEMPFWTGPSAAVSVSHPSNLNIGSQSVPVTVTSGGNPVSFARVCLSKGEDDYRVGFTNALGQVTLPFRSESAGAITIVVTGRNLRRYQGTINVIGTGAWVAINSITVDDDNVGGTSGNNNQLIEGGEIVDLGITVRNNGGTATSGVVDATLREADNGVALLDSTASGVQLAPGQSVLLTGGFRVAFEDTLPDEYAVPFTLAIKNNGTITWKDTFKKEVHEPRLELVRLRIDDTGTGNGNGIVEAGERFRLFYQVKNFGTGAFPGGSVVVTDVDGFFTVHDGLDTYGSIASMASAENSAGFDLTESNVNGEHRLALLLIDIYGRTQADSLELRPPAPPSGIVIDPSLGSDRLEVSWVNSISPDAAHYRVYRSTTAVGPFTLASIDPVAHAVYLDIGLSPNSLYYYRVTTVDESGNESAPSPTVSGSTNPKQLAGWPQAMAKESAASPAVGDLDGDGDLEVVACADRVYAWHHDGVELVDGDGDPQTWGVLSPLGNTFAGHPALGMIDSQWGLDIVAASFYSKEVFVFTKTGAVAAGWPRTTEFSVRAGMVVGDINNDGFNEVIAVDEQGVVYVWKRDGTEFLDGDSNPATQGVFFRMQLPMTTNYSTPCVADVDADGKDEIIVASQNNYVYVLNDNGSVSPGWPYILPTDVAGSPAVGDVDNNGDLEIIVYEAIGNYRVFNHDGSQLVFQFFSNNPNPLFFNPSPVCGNTTGDAKLEMFVPTRNGKLYAMGPTGVVLPGWPVTYSNTAIYTECSPVIADIDGDGSPDIMLGDESQYIRCWDMNGQMKAGFPLATGDAMRGVPQVIDLDQDGDLDVVAAGWDKKVYVWDFTAAWNPAKAPWSRFHANVHNNGRLNYQVPTPVGGVSFSFARVARGVELQWIVPEIVDEAAGGVFSLSRAEVVGGAAGAFHAVATDVHVTEDGMVRWVDATVEEGGTYAYRLEGEGGIVHETAGVYVPVRQASLGQNYPNPFNPSTKIEYRLPETGGGGKTDVSVVVYDVRGARVRTLVNGTQAAGKHVVEWDGRNDSGSPVGSGVYFYRMTTNSFSSVRKMVLLK